ncbi:origin recognition complex subunit 2-like [Plakobranchus ocellatus]|uniref:Origin recognition complex subunit 2 n=1 Tax=Plakobranchus ocellatus TaxID=259542 RepID=A0AAV4E107_9GAST|nr:origin recognition complex subunit 2-like [Plakobranchus ocellatus]
MISSPAGLISFRVKAEKRYDVFEAQCPETGSSPVGTVYNKDLLYQDLCSFLCVDDSSEEDDDEDLRKTEDRDGFLAGAHMVDSIHTAASAEAYFDLYSQTQVTSNRTLAALQGPRLDVDLVRSVLAKLIPGHAKHCKVLMDKHVTLFNNWMLHMCCGFNILLHGLGSKRDLLEQFREKHLIKFSHLVVNGYFPSLTIKHILNAITEDLMKSSKGFTNTQAQLEYIKKEYINRDEDMFLMIHNIDGILLRSDKCQAILSLLAEIKGFHIIASLDHINAGFLWEQMKYFRFRWLWYETPTFASYGAENFYENSFLVQQSGGLALSSLAHVMRSLTPNARQIFLVLAEYQLENGDSTSYTGMSFQGLYHMCREAFLVNSDLTLQAQLVEFKDHRLLKAKKNFEGVEHLFIPIDMATLKEFLQDYKNHTQSA